MSRNTRLNLQTSREGALAAVVMMTLILFPALGGAGATSNTTDAFTASGDASATSDVMDDFTGLDASPMNVAMDHFAGFQGAGATTDPVDALSDTLCPVVHGTTLPNGAANVECPQGTLWVNHYNGPYRVTQPADGRATHNAVSPDGETVFSFSTSGRPGGIGRDLLVLAHDSETGLTLWEARYEAQFYSRFVVWTIGAVSPDSDVVYVTGGPSYAKGSASYLTVAYDAATGEQLWVAHHEGLNTDHHRPLALAVSPDGTQVAVTGGSVQPSDREGSGGYEFAWLTLAYDAQTGEDFWVNDHFGPWVGISCCANSPFGMAFSRDGETVFVTGGEQVRDAGGSLVCGSAAAGTAAYDAATGATLWEAIYDNGCIDLPAWDRVAVSPDGGTLFILVESSQPAPEGEGPGRTNSLVLAAYDATTGALLRETRDEFTPRTGIYSTGMRMSPDGGTLFARYSTTNDDGTESWYRRAYDADTGDELWTVRYTPPHAESSQQRPRELAVSPEGGMVLFTGWATGDDGNRVFTTLAADAETGDELWVARYERGGRSDHSYALAVDPNGERVYVSGSTRTQAGIIDATTIAYPMDGPTSLT